METESEETYREPIPMETSIWFSFTGFPIKHEELTKFLGIEPTIAWNVGDQSPSCSKPRILGFSGWRLESTLDSQLETEEHLLSICNTIFSKKEIIKKISKEIGPPVLEIILSTDPEFYEAFFIEPNILKELGDMGIQIQVHLYPHTIK